MRKIKLNRYPGARVAGAGAAKPATAAAKPAEVAHRPGIVDLATMAAALAQSPAWVQRQARDGDLPHYRTPRGPGGAERMTFPFEAVMAWHDRKFGRNLPAPAPEVRPIRPIL